MAVGHFEYKFNVSHCAGTGTLVRLNFPGKVKRDFLHNDKTIMEHFSKNQNIDPFSFSSINGKKEDNELIIKH